MGLSERTLKRWRAEGDQVTADKRLEATPVIQPHQLTAAEEQAILITCNLKEYQSLPPSQIVPLLADMGIYVASEASFYRVLKKHRQLNHGGTPSQDRAYRNRPALPQRAPTRSTPGTSAIARERSKAGTGTCI